MSATVGAQLKGLPLFNERLASGLRSGCTHQSESTPTSTRIAPSPVLSIDVHRRARLRGGESEIVALLQVPCVVLLLLAAAYAGGVLGGGDGKVELSDTVQSAAVEPWEPSGVLGSEPGLPVCNERPASGLESDGIPESETSNQSTACARCEHFFYRDWRFFSDFERPSFHLRSRRWCVTARGTRRTPH